MKKNKDFIYISNDIYIIFKEYDKYCDFCNYFLYDDFKNFINLKDILKFLNKDYYFEQNVFNGWDIKEFRLSVLNAYNLKSNNNFIYPICIKLPIPKLYKNI